MRQSFPYPAGPGTAAMRGFGAATRTAQVIGIECLDYAKHSYDDAAATLERLAAARGPAEVLAIQGAFLRSAAERFAGRSAVFAGLFSTLAADLVRSYDAAGARRPV